MHMKNKIYAIILAVAAVCFAVAAIMQFNSHGILSFIILLSAAILDLCGALFYFIKKPATNQK